MDFWLYIYAKITLAILTFPTMRSWMLAFLSLLVIMVFCLPIGLWVKFLRIRVPELSYIKAIFIMVHRFFFPCFAEEIVFRVLLLPSKNSVSSVRTQLLLATLSLTAYIISHPLNAIFFYRKALGIFNSPFFLASTLILGITCTLTYLESGSIWAPILVHWTTIICWIFLLDGYSKLNF